MVPDYAYVFEDYRNSIMYRKVKETFCRKSVFMRSIMRPHNHFAGRIMATEVSRRAPNLAAAVDYASS